VERERQALENEPPGAAAGEVLDGDPHPAAPCGKRKSQQPGPV
jgi:hypothetical protein